MRFRFLRAAALAFLGGGATNGATIAYEGAIAPPGVTVIASNTTPNGAGLLGNNDYTDNAGPPGETFVAGSATTLRSITILGGGGGGLNNIHLLVGSVNTSTRAVTPLNGTLGTGGGETAPVPASFTDYVTYQLATPIALAAGATYVFGLYSDNGYYGLAHGSGSTAGAVNFNDTNTFESDNSGRPAKNGGFGSFAVTNTGNYQYDYIASSTVPEPASLGILGLAAMGLLTRRRV